VYEVLVYRRQFFRLSCTKNEITTKLRSYYDARQIDDRPRPATSATTDGLIMASLHCGRRSSTTLVSKHWTNVEAITATYCQQTEWSVDCAYANVGRRTSSYSSYFVDSGYSAGMNAGRRTSVRITSARCRPCWGNPYKSSTVKVAQTTNSQ
jgi:hypothetical protein